MPYITQEDRHEEIPVSNGFEVTREEIGEVMGDAMRNGGDLQYMLAVAINRHLENTGLRYQNCQDVMGALSGALAEFQRVVVGPYEEEKIAENGSVYTVQSEKGIY